MIISNTSNNTNFYQTVLDFEKYAKFLSKNFDITIQFESVKAETDGKVIYLPRLENFTTKEISMLYGILLHEIGHILFSSFDEKYFLALKTEDHAHLANSIEDARIENLLIKRFGGAIDIFNDLYNNYLHDKELMKKVFKFTGRKPSLFYSFSFYIHNFLVNFEVLNFKKFVGVKNFKALNNFIKDKDIDSILTNAKLNNCNDVLKLTNTLHDLFHNYFSIQDQSNPINYGKEIQKTDSMHKKLEDLKQESFKKQKEIDELKIQQEEVSNEKNEFMESHEDLIHEYKGNIDNLNYIIENIKKEQTTLKEYIQLRKNLLNLPSKIQKLEQEIIQKDNQIKELEDNIASGLNKKGKPFSPEKIQSMKDSLQQKKEKVSSINSSIKDLENFQKETLQSLEKMEQSNNSNQELSIDDLNTLQTNLQNDLTNFVNELNKNTTQLECIEKIIDKFDKTIDSIQSKVDKTLSDIMEKTAQLMKELHQTSQDEDFDVSFMPDRHYEESWPEAAQIQEKFDEKATKDLGKIVYNGEKQASLFGSNIQDIVLLIDKKQSEVKEIDVLSIFKDKIHHSKIEDIISKNSQTNFQEDQSINGIFGTLRSHLPLTTEFDVVVKKNHNTDQHELNSLLQNNHVFYQQLKQTFTKIFKFSKKQFWRGAQEEGELDARNLWKIPTNQGNDFYEINNPKFINKVAVSILVDISGSQNKENTGYGEKLKSLVLGLSNALDSVHVKHEIIGYHAPICQEMRASNASSIYTRRSNNLETVIFKEVSQKDKSGILNIIPQMTDNSDGESLRIAIKRLKKISAKNHLVFLISDGKPFLSDSDISVLDEDFRQSLTFAQREKVHVFGFGFFDQLKFFLNDNFCNATNSQQLIKFCEQKLNKYN
jgi:hypothetical protein